MITDAALWVGVLAGPVAWAIDLTISYAMVKWTCGHQRPLALYTMSAAALIVIGFGAAVSCSAPRPTERARFLWVLGMLMSTLFAAAVVATAIPRFVFDVCQ